MMRKIQCIAVDDDPLSLQQITGYIERVEFLNLAKSLDNAFDALNYLKTHSVDLIFLDIEMDELTGIDLIESLKVKPHFIFTTAHEQYALKAFELQATDYLQKPLSFKRFMKAVDHFVQNNLATINPQYIATAPSQKIQKESLEPSEKEFIFIKTKYRMQRLFFDDIYYIKGLNNYLILKTRNKTLYTIQSFKKFSQVLPAENFVRIHKSYVVAIDKIDVIGKNQIYIMDEPIPIGESYKEYFFNYLIQQGLLIN